MTYRILQSQERRDRAYESLYQSIWNCAGVGFRPTVKRHADACDIAGSVSNKGPYVEIFAEGSEECVHSFIKQIQEEPPKRAVILKLDVENVESGEDGIHKVESETDSKEKFQIIESEKKKEKSSYPRTLPFARNVEGTL